MAATALPRKTRCKEEVVERQVSRMAVQPPQAGLVEPASIWGDTTQVPPVVVAAQEGSLLGHHTATEDEAEMVATFHILIKAAGPVGVPEAKAA